VTLHPSKERDHVQKNLVGIAVIILVRVVIVTLQPSVEPLIKSMNKS
jgi:hypothetical protein